MADKRPIVNPADWEQIQSADRLEVESIVSPSSLTIESSTNGPRTLKELDDRDGWGLKTGLIDGGEITINGGDPTKVDIAAGVGIIIDFETDPTAPNVQEVSFGPFTAVTITNLATEIATSIFIDELGAVQQTNEPVGPPESREWINLGVATHQSGVQVDSIANNAELAYGQGSTSDEFIRLFGELNLEGNIYSANGANLLLDKGAGETFSVSANKGVDLNNPNRVTSGIQTGITTYIQSYRDGVGGFNTGVISAIDPTVWDDGSGVLQAVGANNWTIKVIHFASGLGLTTVEEGQKQYNSQAEAEAGIMDAIIRNPDFAEIARRAWVITRNNTTALNSSEVTIRAVPNLDLGGISSGGTAGSGDVAGPASAVDDNLVAFDGTTGKLVKDSLITSASVSGHIASTANPHSTSIANIGSGTQAELETALSDVVTVVTDNAGEIATFTEKVTPVSADLLVIEDSADSNNKKRVQVGNLPSDSTKLDVVASINTQTGTTYTLLASDNGGVVTLNNAATVTVTVPSGLGQGFNCTLIQLGAGVVTTSPSGTTINNRNGHTDTAGQFAAVTLVSYAADTFLLQGDTA